MSLIIKGRNRLLRGNMSKPGKAAHMSAKNAAQPFTIRRINLNQTAAGQALMMK